MQVKYFGQFLSEQTNWARGERTKQIIMRIRAIKGSGEALSNHVSTLISEPKLTIKEKSSNLRKQLKEISHSVTHSASQPNSQQTNQPTNQKKLTDQPTNQPTKQPPNEPIRLLTNHGADQPNYSQNKRLRPPLPRKFHREEGRKGGRKEGIKKLL